MTQSIIPSHVRTVLNRPLSLKEAGAESIQHLDEPRLIERILDGDRAAYGPLVKMYEPAVYGLCYRLLGGGRAEAEDLSQETFWRAYSRLGELKDRRRFAPWLFQIARSLCRDALRKFMAERRALAGRLDLERSCARGKVSEINYFGAHGPGADDADADGPGASVLGALGELPEEQKLALELKYFEGLSYKEIAERMELSFARVDHLIRQAKSRLGRRVSSMRTSE